MTLLLPDVGWRIDPTSGLLPDIGTLARNGKHAAWQPQPGSQDLFLNTTITELLYSGTRGPGKTDTLLMDFAQHVGPDDRTGYERAAGAPQLRGFGAEWRGVLFRKTYPELQDVIDKSKKWFPLLFTGAVYNEARSWWTWPTGEKLMFRPFMNPRDYWNYHGHAYPWIGWEELTTWADDKCFKSMFSCSRSPRPGIPKKIRSTTNPHGVGHNWVKLRYNLPVPPGKYIQYVEESDSESQPGLKEPARAVVHGLLRENQILLRADPEYVSRLVASAPSKAALEAWLKGSWDITSGGMFDDIWGTVKRTAVIKPFDPPPGWTVDRAYDWGDSKPFAFGWFAESNGDDLTLSDGSVMHTLPGDVFMFNEYYGWNGQPNEGVRMLAVEQARKVVEREIKWGLYGRVRKGPADSSIFDENNGNCVERDLRSVVRVDGKAYAGPGFIKAEKGPGSRVQGWQQIRQRLINTMPGRQGVREKPGFFVTYNCRQWLRTVPSLPRSEKNPDDVDSAAEDHLGDMTRYRLLRRRATAKSGTTVGNH